MADHGSVVRPVFDVPFEARANPHAETVRPGARDWAARQGFFGPQPGAGGEVVWTEQAWERHDVAGLGALCFPDAPADVLALVTDWASWGFFLDDYFLAAYSRRRDHPGARGLSRRLGAITSGAVTARGPTSVETGLIDLWQRSGPVLGNDRRALLAASTSSTVDAFLWELQNLLQDRLADPVDYIEMRRRSSYGEFMVTMVRLVVAPDLPFTVFDSKAVRTLNETFMDALGLANDVLSYDKEVHREGEVNNLVLITEDFLDTDLRQAVHIVRGLVQQRIDQFEVTSEISVPAMTEERGIGGAVRGMLDGYVLALKAFMAGAFHWYSYTLRYAAPSRSTLPALRHRPVGLHVTR